MNITSNEHHERLATEHAAVPKHPHRATACLQKKTTAMDHICYGLELLEQEERTAVLAAAALVLSTVVSDLNARLYTDLTGERVRRPRRRRFAKGAPR